MKNGISLTGIKAIDKKLKSLEPKVAKKVLRQSMRKGLAPVKAAVLENVPVDTGALKESVKIKTGARSRNTIRLDVVTGDGDFKGDEFYGSFQEYGYHVGDVFIPGKGFMRKAYDTEKTVATSITIEAIKDGILREAKA